MIFDILKCFKVYTSSACDPSLTYTYIWGRPTESSGPYLRLTYILWSSDFT